MDTPKKLRDVSGEGSDRWTPFRERAVEEKRMKDELLMSATPGLKRRTERWDHSNKVKNDPEELKSYLKDLSAVLALQERRNLTDVLSKEERKPSSGPEKDLETERGIDSSPCSNLKESVFSLLTAERPRSKVRRVQSPIVIRDALTGDAVDAVTSDTFEPVQSMDVEPMEVSDMEIGPINVDKVRSSEPAEDVEQAPALNGAELDIPSDDTYMSDSGPDEPERLSTSSLRRCLRLYMAREDFQISKGGWTALQRASELLLKAIAQEMRDEEGRIIPDRQSILKAFKSFNVIAPNSGNEALFEVCCNYLTLEDLNKLETALFP